MLLTRLNETECLEEMKVYNKYINNLKVINDNVNLLEDND